MSETGSDSRFDDLVEKCFQLIDKEIGQIFNNFQLILSAIYPSKFPSNTHRNELHFIAEGNEIILAGNSQENSLT